MKFEFDRCRLLLLAAFSMNAYACSAGPSDNPSTSTGFAGMGGFGEGGSGGGANGGTGGTGGMAMGGSAGASPSSSSSSGGSVLMPPIAGDPYPSEAIPLGKCAADTMQWWRGAGLRDITFVAFGDSQAADMSPGCSPDAQYADDQNTLQRQAINSITAHNWPAGANGGAFFNEGSPYDHVRGVAVAGDLTQNGSEAVPVGTQLGHDCREYTLYRQAFGRCGTEGALLFPVYEAYGNHDFPWIAGVGDPNYHPVVDYLDQITAAHRPGEAADLYDDPSPGTNHFAWRWDDMWFVNLDVKPGTEVEVLEKNGFRHVSPLDSLGFFRKFLDSRSATTTRQIVVMTHYPIGSSRILDSERTAFCKLISDAQNGTGPFANQKLAKTNPVIYIHGHTHAAPAVSTWTCPAPHASVSFPIFDVGTPFYQANPNGPGRLHFTVMRIGGNRVEAAGVSADAKNPTGPWTYLHKTRLDIMNQP